jgi:hypothetical protein
MPVLYQGARKHPLSEIIEKQRREVIDEDYLVIPKEELKRQYQAVRQFDETERLQSRADRNTAFKIDKLIKNLAEAVSSELQQAVKMVDKALFLDTLKKPKRGRPRTDADLEQAKEDLSQESSPKDIISAWNNLVLYIRSFDKVKGIGLRDMKELWLKLTDEVLPNVSSLLSTLEMTGPEYYSRSEQEQIQLLENYLLQKRLMPISLVSLESREVASERQRKDVNKQSLQLAFDKIDKMLSSKLNEDDLEIIKNLPSNEVFEIERHLIEISHLANSGKPGQKKEADRRLEELIDDIARKNVVREKAPIVKIGPLEAFERKAQKMNEKQLIYNKNELVKKLYASQDSTMSAELQARIQVINEIMQERDIIAEGVVELPESIPAPKTEKKKRGRKKKVEEEVEEDTFEDMPPLEPADIEEVEFIGEGRNPVIFDDMMNDHYYMLKRLNRK